MTRILRWTLFLAVVLAFSGGCDSRKDQIPTKIQDKAAPPPQLPGAEKKGAQA